MSSRNLPKLFGSVLAPEQILKSEDDLKFFGKDVSKQFEAKPALILLPKTVSEVSAIMKICNKEKIAVVPSGGRTGYSGGATAQNGEIVLSLSKMTKILEINPIDATVTCEAGVTTENLRNAVVEKGMYYPVDFTSKGSSQIGGNIATNAGGIRVVRYGNTREWVLGLKVVLPDGEILECNGKLWKNQTGYDFRHLVIGSEGTLGVIVEATLKLTTPPRESLLCLCGGDRATVALSVLERIRRSGFLVNVFEYFERAALELVVKHNPLKDPFPESYREYFLIEIEISNPNTRHAFEETMGDLTEKGIVSNVVFAENSKQRTELMALRELIGETANKHTVPHKNDISVPIPAIPDFIEKLRDLFAKKFPKHRTITFGHVGDGNLHVNVLKPEDQAAKEFFKECGKLDEALFSLVETFGGSISAEHGVGFLKKPYLHYSRSVRDIALMKEIKNAFDPLGILNPGKIF